MYKDFDFRYDRIEKELRCSLCNKYHKNKNRLTLLRHIKEDHQTPGTKTIEIDSTNPNFGQKVQDCETPLCQKLYGFCRRNLWCKKCNQKKKIEEVLCQECGKSTKCLKHHIAYYHNDKKYPCLQCDKEFKSPYRQSYIFQVHTYYKTQMNIVHFCFWGIFCNFCYWLLRIS